MKNFQDRPVIGSLGMYLYNHCDLTWSHLLDVSMRDLVVAYHILLFLSDLIWIVLLLVVCSIVRSRTWTGWHQSIKLCTRSSKPLKGKAARTNGCGQH